MNSADRVANFHTGRPNKKKVILNCIIGYKSRYFNFFYCTFDPKSML